MSVSDTGLFQIHVSFRYMSVALKKHKKTAEFSVINILNYAINGFRIMTFTLILKNIINFKIEKVTNYFGTI